MTKNVSLDGRRMMNWDSFHDTFAETFGFPGFYGRNMNAWIDCMTYLDDPVAGMSAIHVTPGDVLVLCISEMGGLKTRCPEIYATLIECAAFVNFRRIELGQPAVLAFSFHD